jgi:hypothetical protein
MVLRCATHPPQIHKIVKFADNLLSYYSGLASKPIHLAGVHRASHRRRWPWPRLPESARATVYCCGPKTAPTALAASYEWDNYVDHVTIRSWHRASAARIPKRGGLTVFEPEVVVWSYEGGAEPTLRALLNLVSPQHPDAPAVAYPAPRSLQLYRHEQRPMTIRLPPAHQARARATRLTGLWRAQ